VGGVREQTLFTIQDGVSPLCVACVYGHTDVVDLLVRAGADVHLATTEVFICTHAV
jgi:ankyrin repeat protein